MDAHALSQEQEKLVNEGQMARAEALLSEWLAHHTSGDTFIPRLELARVLFWRGHLRKARELLERLLNERPGDTWVASFLAQVEIRLGDHDRARELLEGAITQEPHNHEARLFLGGDVVEDAYRARRMMAQGLTSMRRKIELAALCSSIDFRRGRRATIGHGPLTQAFLDRAHLMLDGAAPGEDVEVPASLRAAFLHSERIVYYLSPRLDEALLGLVALSALLRFFELRPEARRPVELVTVHAKLLGALAERHPLVTVTLVREDTRAAEDLRRRRERTCAMTNASPEVSRALAAIARDHGHVGAVLDLHLDRHARGFFPWQSTRPPHRHILTYPARLHRLMEMALGIKLLDDPVSARVTLALPEPLSRRRAEVLRRYELEGAEYHCVAGPCPEALLEEMASGPRQVVALGEEALPEIRDGRVRRLLADLPELACLLAGARTVVSAETGLGLLGAALGRPALILHTETDPFLWSTGSAHLHARWSERAFAAHVNQTPVNDQPRAEPDTLPGDAELIDAWRRCDAPQPEDARGRSSTGILS